MHPWNLNKEEARQLQESLASDCVLEGNPDVQTFAGIDISVYPDSRIGIASAVLYSVSEQEIKDEVILIGDLTFPYIPGLLAFREAPLMLKAIMKLSEEPDCLLVDGHGYAHPRRFGLASHLGLLLEIPSIGCAKSILIGDYEEPGEEPGSYTEIWDGEPIGFAYRSMKQANPIFLSPGNRIQRQIIPELIKNTLNGETRLPIPLHRTDKIARRERNRLENLGKSFNQDQPVLVVGGSLRDLMLGHPPRDYDVLVTSFTDEHRERLKNRFSGSLFALDEDRNIYRLTGSEIQIDVMEVGERDIVKDLKRRDFTINSVALDLSQESWIDPVGGRDDAEDEILRPTHEDSISSDPLRILRAYRLAQYHDLSFHEETYERIRQSVPKLVEVSQERIVSELLKLMAGPSAGFWIRRMREDEVISDVPFFRLEGVQDVQLLEKWSPVFKETEEVLDEKVHGDYRIDKGIQAGRLISQNMLAGWPFHRRIKSIVRSSYEGLPPEPGFDVIGESFDRLVGRILGKAIWNEFSRDQLRESLRNLKKFKQERSALEKSIVESIEDPANIPSRKQAILRDKLPNLWDKIMS